MDRRRFLGSLVTAAAAPASAALAQGGPRRILGADNGHVAIVSEKGELEWDAPLGGGSHDVQLLRGGNVLVSPAPNQVVEVNKEKQVVWRWESRQTGPDRVEIHAFRRLSNGLTMIAETGNRRILEIASDGSIAKTVPLTVEKPNSHRDTRMVRKTQSGSYLVCHEGDGKIREYDAEGKVVWQYALDLNGRPASPGHGPEGHGVEVFGAVRLASGNTLIAGGNNNRVLEVQPDGKIVWSIDQKELLGITLAWITTLQVLPSGNVIFGNCHAGPTNPQLIEVSRDKKVVWTFNDFKNFGNSLAASQVIGLGRGVIR